MEILVFMEQVVGAKIFLRSRYFPKESGNSRYHKLGSPSNESVKRIEDCSFFENFQILVLNTIFKARSGRKIKFPNSTNA